MQDYKITIPTISGSNVLAYKISATTEDNSRPELWIEAKNIPRENLYEAFMHDYSTLARQIAKQYFEDIK